MDGENTSGRSPKEARRLGSVQMREEEYLSKDSNYLDTCKSILTFFLSLCTCGNEVLQQLNDKMVWLFGRENRSRN